MEAARERKASVRGSPSIRGRALALAGAAALLASCASSRAASEPWVYALSREFYTASTAASLNSSFAYSPSSQCGAESAALVYVCIYALPFVLDTAVLPITIPHDLLLVE